MLSSAPPTVHAAATDAQLVAAGLRAFFRLAHLWKLTEEEQLRLLGGIGRSTLFKWRAKAPASLPVETFRAVSLLLGIHALLQKLFPEAPAAAVPSRVRRVGALWFAPEQSLVEYLCDGGPIAMDRVRRHLVQEAGSEVVPVVPSSPYGFA